MSRTLTLPAWLDERFGADLYHCASCNYCVDAVWPERGLHHVCATLEHHSPAPGYSGRGFIDTARALLEGVALDADSVAERVFTCTTCGNCETSCPIGLRPAAIGGALREVLLAADVLPAPVRATRGRIVERGGATEAVAGPWHAPAAAPGDSLAIFAGCAARADGGPATPLARWLEAAGFTLAWQDDGARCCGAPLAELGAAREAGAWRDGLLHDGAAPRVVLGYECLNHLRAGGHADVRSLPAWLDDGLAGGTLALVLRDDVAVPRVRLIESCQLKPRPQRAAGDDERRARDLLARLGVIDDAGAYPNAHALCCGAAGGMPAVAPHSASRMAAARLAGDADALAVTLDARCAAHLARSGTREVTDFASFLARYTRLTRVATAA